MKVRIKYTKTGPVRFISHLDVMRYFQKAIRRANFDISYSGGFSPHQIISFAAPMPLLMESVGEYCDAEFNSVTTTESMIEDFNKVASPYMIITDIVILPDDAKNSMSIVAASDYVITLTETGENNYKGYNKSFDDIKSALSDIANKEEINILKKTKKNEKITNIRPSIKVLNENEGGIYMLLNAGSIDNLKPELVMEAICNEFGVPYSRFDYNIMRLETYMDVDGELKPLSVAGERF